MALNLQKHLQAQGLPPLHYSNRSLSRGEPLKAAGAIQEETFEDLLRAADIIFTMVSIVQFLRLNYYGGPWPTPEVS